MKVKYSHEQVKQFWVGLIDSDGSIQCNHWRKQLLHYRIVIKMHIQNKEMLDLICQHLGGTVRTYPHLFVAVWAENHQRRIWKLCDIFDTYPPLTTRIRLQLALLKECAMKKDVQFMMRVRDNKYQNRKQVTEEISRVNIEELPYFHAWCSGFITGEGCFSVRKNQKTKSFSIAQKHDKYLLEKIRDFFGGQNRVRVLKDEMFVWQVYRRSVITNIIHHCDVFPLLGHKKVQLEEFIKVF